MAYRIIWTANAVNDLHLIMTYLRQEWSQNTADHFYKKVTRVTIQLSLFPNMAARLKDAPEIHCTVVSQQNILYYEVNEADETIGIIAIYDTRQDPNKAPF